MARPGLTGHIKFRRLSRSLGSNVLARGYLELLWDSCYESGDEYVGTAEDIETLLGWTGETGMLTRALVEAGAPEGFGFIEPTSDVVDGGAQAYRIHDLWHHAPEYVSKRRKREIERQQKSDPSPERRIVSDRRTAPNGAEWRRLPECQDGDGGTPSPSHSPSPSHEKEISAKPNSPTFLAFPTIGPQQGWTLSEAQVAEWASLFPGLDVRGECRKALAWVKATPNRRKTAKGMEKFLVGWLSRAVDRGRVNGGRTEPAAVPSRDDYAWTCPHEPQCLGRHACQVKQTIAAGKARAS